MLRDPRTQMLACAADAAGDVAAGALWLAAEDCDGVDVDAALRHLDDLGDELRTRIGSSVIAARAPVTVVPVVQRLLDDRLRLRPGNGREAEHHYLHTVLARGEAVPIAAAAVWMATGRRAGVPVEGVGLPGHFVIRVAGLLVDPHSGEPLTEQAATELVARALGRPLEILDRALFRATTPREMLARMSRNLRACHSAAGRMGPALRAADRCVALMPDDPSERRDRGVLLFRTGRVMAALRDIDHYLEQVPEAADREAVERLQARARALLN